MAEKSPLFIRIADAVTRYSVSVSTINRALRNGELTRHKRGRCTLLELAEADAWARGEAQPANQ